MQEYTKTARLDASLAVFAFMYVCHFIFISVPVGQTNLQKGLGMKMAASRIVAASAMTSGSAVARRKAEKGS